jgi:hypothetical protein
MLRVQTDLSHPIWDRIIGANLSIAISLMSSWQDHLTWINFKCWYEESNDILKGSKKQKLILEEGVNELNSNSEVTASN